jgi:GNAT superfamily N-acetyltransferase
MISIRPMTAEDVPVAQDLLAQLGYRMDVPEVRRRYEAIIGSEEHAVMVAARDGRVISLCHMYARPAFDKPPEVIVQALVVDQAARGLGVGKLMMAAAEAWAERCGFKSVALASHISRSDAHTFYESLGYRNESTSHQFRRWLGEPT